MRRCAWIAVLTAVGFGVFAEQAAGGIFRRRGRCCRPAVYYPCFYPCASEQTQTPTPPEPPKKDVFEHDLDITPSNIAQQLDEPKSPEEILKGLDDN